MFISMSAIDFYCSVDKVKGVDGKDRVVITFDGKYLPYTEQVSFHFNIHDHYHYFFMKVSKHSKFTHLSVDMNL